jgi:hypothetical protein
LDPEQPQVTPNVSALPAEHRSKLRVGFARCSAAFALALVFNVVNFGAVQIASSSDANFRETHVFELKLAANAASTAIDALLIAGLTCLYLARIGQRWRLVNTITLALLGVDLAIVCFDVFGTDAVMMELTRNVGLSLKWVVLWLIAVLAAEAAESIERPDVIYQTEVTGRVIVWGAVTWLAYLIWSFNPKMLDAQPNDSAILEFALVVYFAAVGLQLFAYGRTALFCGGLATALSPNQDQAPPGQTV